MLVIKFNVALNYLESFYNIPKARGNNDGYPISSLKVVLKNPDPTSLNVEVVGSIKTLIFLNIFAWSYSYFCED